jgi:hypothetical protein
MDPNTEASEDQPASRRRVPFLAHQIAEYVVAVTLIVVGFHSGGGAEISLVTSGALLAALNLISSGPLGLFDVLGRRAHHAGDLVIAAALIALPIVFASRLHIAGIAISEAVAVLIIWMERSTSYVATLKKAGAARPSSSGARAAGAATAALSPEAAKAAKVAARRIGLVAGVTRRVVRERRDAAKVQGN